MTVRRSSISAASSAAPAQGAVTSLSVTRIVAVKQGDAVPELADGNLVVYYTPDGTRYFTDFSEYTSGVAPSDWSQPWDAGTWTVETVAGVSGGKLLRNVQSDTNRRLLTWNAVSGDAARGDAEILYKWRTTSSSVYVRAAVRAAGDGSTETGYVGGQTTSTESTITSYLNATTTTLGTGVANTTSANTWYRTRFRCQGTTVQIKTWLDTVTEPGAWDLTVTSSVVSAAGAVGVFSPGSGTREVDWFSVATGGWTANPAP